MKFLPKFFIFFIVFSSMIIANKASANAYDDLDIDPEQIMCTISWNMIYKPVVAKLPGSDKLKHCTISCMVAKNCSEEATFIVGLLKELADMMGQGTPEFGDIMANIKGIELSRGLDTQLMCYPTCKQHF